MEYIGRRVRKKLLGHGTFSGSVESYEQVSGTFKIAYGDGSFEDFQLSDLLPQLEPLEFSDTSPTSNPNKRRRVDENLGQINGNSVVGDGFSGNLVTESENSGQFDLNLNENDSTFDVDGGGEDRGGAELQSLDSTYEVKLEFDGSLDLNKMVVEEYSGVNKNFIDLNLGACDEFENRSGDKLSGGFDLNLELIDTEVRDADECEDQFVTTEKVNSSRDVQIVEQFEKNNDEVILGNSDGAMVSNIENNKGEKMTENLDTGVDNRNIAPLTAPKKKRGRKKKGTLSNNVDEVIFENSDGAVVSNIENKEDTMIENLDSGADNGIVAPLVAPKRRGRKKKGTLNNNVDELILENSDSAMASNVENKRDITMENLDSGADNRTVAPLVTPKRRGRKKKGTLDNSVDELILENSDSAMVSNVENKGDIMTEHLDSGADNGTVAPLVAPKRRGRKKKGTLDNNVDELILENSDSAMVSNVENKGDIMTENLDSGADNGTVAPLVAPKRRGRKKKGTLDNNVDELILENSDDAMVSNVESKEDNMVENMNSGVDNGDATPLIAPKKRGRKKKGTLNKNIEISTQETTEVDDVAQNMIIDFESRYETLSKNCSESVDDASGILGSAGRGIIRKRIESSDNIITSPTPEIGLRRSSRRAKMAAISGQDLVFSPVGLESNTYQYGSSAVSSVSRKKSKVATRGKRFDHSIIPLKVELPPSSSNLDIDGVTVFDIVSVYAFLRSFGALLFLSPFELDDFVASVKFPDSTLLFDSIHLSILRMLRKHLVSLSDEGSVSASNCLRSLNWDFVDLITWPMFVVEYLLLHSPVRMPCLDLNQVKPFSKEYYKMPAPAKFEILRHICDDVIEVEAFRLELNRRTLAIENFVDLERSVKLDSAKKRKAVMEVANTSCIIEDNVIEADGNSDDCRLCKMDGNLLCCDGCPAAFHSRCVGVVTSLLPEGDWYCPECAIEKDKPWTKVGKSIRGAELFGIDHFGREYYSSCGYLLVLELRNDDHKCSYYSRNDLPGVIEAVESSSFLSHTIVSAIRQHWNIVHGVGGTRNDLDTSSYSMESAHRKKQHLSRHPEPLEALDMDKAVTESPMKLVNTEDNCTALTIINVEQTDNLNAANVRSEPSDVKSGKQSSQVYSGSNYVNCYEFARTAALAFEELTRKASNKISGDARKTIEEIIAIQLKVVSNWSAEFSWSNIQTSNVHLHQWKEKCGWCFYCRVPEHGVDCLFIKNDNIAAVEKFTCEALGINLRLNRENHLIDVMCHMISIEDNLQGLLVGPWLNPHYSALWRKSVVEAPDIASLKILLIKLASNLHHLVLSADWWKLVDSVALMGSASHIVKNVRASSKQGLGKKSKHSVPGIMPSLSAVFGLLFFWWRGGRGSRKLFNCKVLPRALASKAARQGGCKKIPGIQYPEVGENNKRTNDIAWRAAVETSRSMDQLALQIRELNANIRWNDIRNSSSLSKTDKESKKPIRSFKKVLVRKKSSEGTAVRYLLDFGKRRFIPDIVMKHGSLIEDASSQKKKYWLEEPHVPLHLLKAFEEKRIARKSNLKISNKLRDLSRVTGKPFKKKGFSYLFSRAEKPENYKCGHCNKDVIIRIAVSCQYCKGFFHKRHVQKSAKSSSAECLYTCQKCGNEKLVTVDASIEKSEIVKQKNASKKGKRGKGKKTVKGKQLVNNTNKKRVQVVVPLRRSTRHAERNTQLAPKKKVLKKRKKRNLAKTGKNELKKANNGRLMKVKNGRLMKVKNGRLMKSNSGKWMKGNTGEWKNATLKKQRTYLISSHYWLKGLQFTRRLNDERALHFRSKMLLVLSGDATSTDDKPLCSLCGELEYSLDLCYLACETCGVWFHGDALELTGDKIENLIGFKCHICLNKNPPFCPHLHSSTGNSNAEKDSEDNMIVN